MGERSREHAGQGITLMLLHRKKFRVSWAEWGRALSWCLCVRSGTGARRGVGRGWCSVGPRDYHWSLPALLRCLSKPSRSHRPNGQPIGLLHTGISVTFGPPSPNTKRQVTGVVECLLCDDNAFAAQPQSSWDQPPASSIPIARCLSSPVNLGMLRCVEWLTCVSCARVSCSRRVELYSTRLEARIMRLVLHKRLFHFVELRLKTLWSFFRTRT